jgi:hypothetical protein
VGQAGRLEEAKQALQKAIAVAPKSCPLIRVEDYEHMLEDLHKAGYTDNDVAHAIEHVLGRIGAAA